MDSSSNVTAEKHESSQSMETSSVQRPEATGGCSREKRRRDHNDNEKKRKEQIKACICKMGELLPPSYVNCERHSTLEIVEKSLNYMRELKEARTKFSVTEDNLQEEIRSLKKERDKFLDIIKAAGLSSESIPTNGVSSTTDVKADSPKPTKHKSKKRNLLSSQIQQEKEKRVKEKQHEHEMISSSVSMSEDGSNTMQANQLMNMPTGAAFINGQNNVMFNPMMMPGGNQYMMSGMPPNAGNQVMPIMPPEAPCLPNMQQNTAAPIASHTPNSVNSKSDGSTSNNLNKSSDESDAGLLQLAMQDAGITPSSGAGQSATTPSNLTPSIADINAESEQSTLSHNNPLQTLASVAASNHDMMVENSAPSDMQSVQNMQQPAVNSVNNSNLANMTSGNGQCGGVQAGNNTLLNMPVMANQPQAMQAAAGQQQMQRIMFVNEQGIPMIADVPVGMDANNAGMFQNAQKAGMLAGGQGQSAVIKEQAGNIEQNAIAIAQQQANIQALQNQLLNQGAAAGSNFPNVPFQQQGVLQSNIIQTANGQLIQQIAPQMQAQLQAQGQLIGMNSQGQGIVVAGQQGPMALNTMPSQPNQLPSALILPNGQIVPVVTNPGSSGASQSGMNLTQGQMTRMSAPQLQAGVEGQLISSQGGPGLLIPAASVGGQTSSTATSLTTSVTNALNSVMTTQIQGSTVQTQKLMSATGTQSSVSTCSQAKLVSLSGPAPAANTVGLQAAGGSKSSTAPILISLPINGQSTTVLLDPNTMQVLGTVQPGQQTPQPLSAATMGQVGQNISVTSQSSVTPVPSVPTGIVSKAKNKNNGNQRIICPKPNSNEGGRQASLSKKKKSGSKSNKNKGSIQTEGVTDSLQIQIPESTTDPETVSAISAESTDILAKAAESIFSSPTGEVATVAGFYNPANEDNPLTIDTSVNEQDDDKKSPTKQANKASVSKTSVLHNSVLGLNSVADIVSAESSKVSLSNVVNDSSTSVTVSAANNDNVTSLSATLEEIAGLQFGDTGASSEPTIPKNVKTVSPERTSKKGKAFSKNEENKKEGSSKTGGKSKSKSAASRKQQQEESSKHAVQAEKLDSDSQSMDIESTLIHIPDEITFNPNDLSDVLDQVEQLGTIESPADKSASVLSTPTSSKKSKLKRGRAAAELDIEPIVVKKRKSGKEAVKETKAAAAAPARDLLSMPTNLSVYDFDDSHDIVPLLPLNGKEFTNISNATPKSTDLGNSTKSTDLTTTKSSDLIFNTSSDTTLKNDSKSKQSTGQYTSKSKTSANTPKASKGSKSSVKESEDVLNKDLATSVEIPLHPSKAAVDSKNKENVKLLQHKVEPIVQVTESPSTITDLDTTTSLFGFPVPKKQQRVDMTAKQNVNKPASVPSPSHQSTAAMLSPKQTIVSPKQPMASPKSQSQSSVNMDSPQHTSMAFSPDMVSPKLSIVSPGQSVMSDNEVVVSPSPKQHIKETSPLKKRTPPSNRVEAVVKTSPVSAFNTVTVPVTGHSVTSPMSKFEGKLNMKPNMSPVYSQSTGVITSTKSATSLGSSDSMNKQHNNSAKVNTGNFVDKPVLADKSNINLANPSNNMQAQKPPMPHTRHSSGNTNMDTTKFNTALNASAPLQRSPASSVNTSQNNRYGPQYGSDPGYGAMSMPANRPMSNDPNPAVMANYPSPYSNESIFNPQAEKVIKSPPNVNISTLNQPKPDNNMSKIRNNPYSVDSFVESSRDDGMRSQPEALAAHSSMLPGADLANPSSDFSRLHNESSPDGFNFANIGLHLQPITSTAGNYMESSSSGPLPASSFSFSLSSSTATVSTSSTAFAQQNFPFLPLLSSASNVPSSQSALPALDMYDQNRGNNDPVQRNNTVMHPAGTSGLPRSDNQHMSRGDPMPRPDKGPPPSMSANSQSDATNKPSCSKQKLPKAPGPATIRESFPPYNNTSSTHDTNFYHDNSMKANVGKSPTEQMRKPQDKPMDMGQSQSRSSSQTSLPDKRGTNMARSPQMMNNPQSYYPPANFPPKSLTTPPLHHPSMMAPDDRVRNITNRSPYESGVFPPPPASQGFSNMGPNFSGNHFDSGPPNFSRDNSGTRPLSHTPVNTGGRKSTNPPQTSVVKPPQKHSAPPLLPMGGSQQGSIQASRPTPPQSHRANTPHGNTQPTPNPPQMNQSRQSKPPSRSSKPPSKKSKTLPFMEVDSNLSNSIFETNRSMTPFLPMQNLSPQSRAMQYEGSSFLPGNLFGPGPRFPNSNTPIAKNSEIGAPFNPLFPPRGAQNGLGLPFQPGFGMNMNPHIGNHGNGPQLTPHTAPHMANFSLNNIFPEGPSQNESSLNISPIKFPHTNYQGMEHNAMQHHHQYNRGHPSVMSINSILGPNHGFDSRMNTSMAGPFHSHGHPFSMPSLNFPMHDHRDQM